MSLVTLVNPQTAPHLVEIKWHDGSVWSAPVLMQAQEFAMACEPAQVEDVSSDQITAGFIVLKNSRLVRGEFHAAGFMSLDAHADLPYQIGAALCTAFRYHIASSGGTKTSSVYHGLGSRFEFAAARIVPVLRGTYRTQIGCPPPEITPATFT